MQLKFIKSLVIFLLVFSFATNAFAQNTIRNQEQRIDVLNNLAGFFGTFFDLDNSFRFISDDIFIRNECIRRDVFALHTAKTQVSDYMIDNYLTIKEGELDTYQKLYQSYSSELVFLRNLEMLIDPETKLYVLSNATESALKKRVIEDSPSGFGSSIEVLFPEWINSYSLKFNEYETCKNALTKISEQIKSIKKSAAKVSKSGTDFSNSFNKLRSTIYDTPSQFLNNAENNLSYSVLNSFDSTAKNFQSAWGKTSKAFNVFSNFPKTLIESSLEENKRILGTSNNLGQIISTETDLTKLPRIISDGVNNNEARKQYILDQTETAVKSRFTDTANLLFMQHLIEANANLKDANDTLTKEGVGVLNLTKRVGDKQCNA